MKRKIKIIDKINNKVTTKEVAVRDLDHLRAQQKYKATITRDKTKIIPRRQKYKARRLDQYENN